MGLLAAGQWQPELGKSLRAFATSAGMVTFFVGLWLGLAWHVNLRAAPLVVVAPEAVARFGPLEESQSAFTLATGAELSALDQKNDWLQIRDSSGRIGWLRSGHAAIVGPESALKD
jgi:hypothetical protein